jgi:aryl-alcohol dehydrogenase-like predicted oxidoreductase
MKYIKSNFGKITSIGFGSLQCSDKAVILTAVEKGINFFMTAEAYGDFNQRILGETLKSNKNIFIATKVGINFMGKTDEEKFTQSRAQIRASVYKCIELIDRKPLNMVSLHRLNDMNILNAQSIYVPAWEEALDELIRLQKEGLIQHIGLSEPTPSQLERAIYLAKERNSSIAAVESAYSIICRRAEENGLKNICDSNGILLIAYASIARGLCNTKLQSITVADFNLPSSEFRKKVFACLNIDINSPTAYIDMFSEENIKHNVHHMLRFHACANEYGVTPSQLALAWVQSKNALPIPGTNNVQNLMQNCESSELVDSLQTKGAFEKLDALFPSGTFQGDPNPILLGGVLDANSEILNQTIQNAPSPAYRMR